MEFGLLCLVNNIWCNMVSRFPRLQNSCLAILSALLLSACSVGMALNGQKDPDLRVIKQNVHRTEVELQLGAPIKVDTASNGQTIAVYEYEVGREPSTGRAVAHGVMDVLTFGIWEVVGTPVEVLKGDKFILVVTYDQNGRVVSATRSQ